MTELQRQLEEAVRGLYRSIKTGQSLTSLINQAIQIIVRRYGTAADLQNAKGQAKDLLRQLDAESWQEFKEQSEGADSTRNTAARLLLGAAQRLDRNDRKAVKEIQKAIRQGMEDGQSWRETAQAAMIKAGVAQQHALTEIETTLAAMDRANTIAQAKSGGVNKFRYDGPKHAERPFCQAHVGNVYTLDEIMNMNNGQGLSVLYYCGGFNCRHRWVPIQDDVRGQVIREYEQKLKNLTNAEYVNLTGLWPKKAKAVYEGAKDFLDQYPEAKVDRIYTESIQRDTNVMVTRHDRRTEKIEIIINLNHQFIHGTDEGFDQYILRNSENGYWAGKDYSDIIYHEMAHVLTLCGNRYEVNRAMISRMRHDPAPWAAQISNYARSDQVEFIAEAFVAMRNGFELPEGARNYIKNYLGDKFP